MLSFDDYKKKVNGIDTIGKQLKIMSDEVMQDTWLNDVQTRQCYIYDYFHDDQPELEYGYNPALSTTKIPVSLKFIVKTYKSIAKDDPEYHIQFEPNVWNSMSCKPDWFVKNYEKLGVQFPIGLLCDIPDDTGVYYRWLVVYSEATNQFPKFGVLKCNYKFQWVENDGIHRHKRSMWGVNSSQNSYTSGVYTDYKFTSFDNQDKFILPFNNISSSLRHDTRLFISMLQKEPWVYKVTKVDNTSPKGVITFTVKQDRFSPDTDYVQLDPEALDYGDMYADYYESDVVPCVNDNFDCDNNTYGQYVLSVEAINNNVKLGSAKVLYAKVYDGENNDVTDLFIKSECQWSFDESMNDLITNKDFWLDEYIDDNGKQKYRFKCKFKFTGDEQYVGQNIYVTCKVEELSSNILLDIITL